MEDEVLKVQSSARHAGHEISTEASVSAAVANLQAMGLTSVQMETAPGSKIRLKLLFQER